MVNKEYIIHKSDQTGLYSVVEYYKGSSVSGGPILAYFYSEELAKEYVNFKTKQ